MLDALETFLAQPAAPPACPTEADFHRLWHARGLHASAPIDQAISGGLLADRLAWVFAAGYQATLRNAFTMLPTAGWAAFAATEDQHDPDAHPGVVLTETDGRLTLNGHKSWVAHSRLVDHLIITINDPAGDKYRARGVVLTPDTVGVTLSHRADPKFLGVMSQGYARLDNVPVAADAIFAFEPIRQFGRTEAKFVMLAATAFMLARSDIAGDQTAALLTTAAALVALITETNTSRQVYAAIERNFQRCVQSFETNADTSAIADYTTDRKLLDMYSAKIQRRGEYARQAARGERADSA